MRDSFVGRILAPTAVPCLREAVEVTDSQPGLGAPRLTVVLNWFEEIKAQMSP